MPGLAAAADNGPPASAVGTPAAEPAAEIEGPLRPEAQTLYARGLERFGAKDYAGAIADFQAGYAIEPRRDFLFAEGQARRLAGDCKGAIGLYQRFLATDPPAVQVNATQIALGRCAQHLAEHPEVVLVEPPRPPPPPPPPPPRWWQDPVGLGLTGAGAVGLALGGAFIAAAYVAVGHADDAMVLDDYNRHWSNAESRRTIGVVALAAGAGLAAAGVTRFVLVRRQADAQERQARLSISIGLGTFGLGGAF